MFDLEQGSLIMKTFYLVVFSAFLGTAYAQDNNACVATADQSLTACNSEADTAKELALAICENSTERDQCITDANTTQASDKVECQAEDVAQNAACEKLGPAAYDPQIDPANYSATVTNPYFPLAAGSTWNYQGQNAEGAVTLEKTVNDETKDVMGVTCTEVRELTKEGEDVVRDTLKWYAQDAEGAVWLFGVNTKELDGDEVTSLDGSWMAGEDDAKPGIIMKAAPAVNDVYRTSYAIRESEDVGEVLSISEAVTVPAGSFTNAVKTNDTTALDPSVVKNSLYASGAGLVSETTVGSEDKLELQTMTPTPTPTPTPEPTPTPTPEEPTPTPTPEEPAPTPTPTPTPQASF
jgi:cell division septation protein DedD